MNTEVPAVCLVCRMSEQISYVELRKACVHLLLSMLCLPLHFKDLQIKGESLSPWQRHGSAVAGLSGGGLLRSAANPTPPSLIGNGPFIFTLKKINPNCNAYDYTKLNVLLAVAISGRGGGVIKEGKVTKDNRSLFLNFLEECFWVT